MRTQTATLRFACPSGRPTAAGQNNRSPVGSARVSCRFAPSRGRIMGGCIGRAAYVDQNAASLEQLDGVRILVNGWWLSGTK